MGENLVYLTNEGIKNLTEELKEVEHILQDSQSNQKEKQFLEQRANAINDVLNNAKTLDPTAQTSGSVVLGSVVKLYDLFSKEVLEYMIVHELEADPVQKKLSITSPVGNLLCKKEVGDIISLTIANEKLSFEILEIK